MKYLSIITIAAFAISCSSAKKEAQSEAQNTEAKVDQAVKSSAPTSSSPAAKNNSSGNVVGEFPMITGTSRSELICTTGADKRLVKVIDRAAEKDCGVVYEKFGNAKTVAMASHDMSFCDKVAENIKGNLTEGGLTCEAPAE